MVASRAPLRGRSGWIALGLAGALPAAPALAQQVAPVRPSDGEIVRVAPTRTPPDAPRARAISAGPPSLDSRLVPAGGTPRGDLSLRLPGDSGVDDDLLTPSARPGQDRSRGSTVQGRARPGYDPLGVPFGGFRLYPRASVALGYESNLFSQPNGREDVYGRARLGADLLSQWSRHALQFDGYVDELAYARNGGEGGTTYDAHGLGRLDIGRSNQITAEARRSRLLVDRGLVGEILPTRRQIRYDLTAASLSARSVFNRLAVDVSAGASHFDYQDGIRPNGGLVSQRFRDFDLYQGRVDVSYAVNPARQVFASVTREWRRFDVTSSPRRDSDVYEILGGIRSEITPLLRGRIALGYIRANFKDPGVKSRGALAIDANLSYLASELTTVNLIARRYFQNVGVVVAPASLTTEVALGADHELLRNVILSGQIVYGHTDYVASAASADRIGGTIGAQWLINRNFRANAAILYRQRTGRGRPIDRDFNQTSALVGLTYAL